MIEFKPSVIFLDEASEKDFVTQKMLSYFNDVPVIPLKFPRPSGERDRVRGEDVANEDDKESENTLPLVPSHRGRGDLGLGEEEEFPVTPDKFSLLLTHNRGRFLRPCPGTKNYICCGYQVLDFAAGCNLGCTYCILQAYLNFPGFVYYTNWEEMLNSLIVKIEANPRRFFRLGTGEFTDSLLLDEITGFSQYLIPRLIKYKNVALELKTKTVNIGNLRDIDHQGKIIVSWSLNTDWVIANEEPDAPSLDERLDAAVRCQELGYKLGFHFDPLIYHEGWEEGYKRVIDELFARITSEKIAWISMGCFRFMPDLSKHIRENRPESKIIYEEFITGEDGKRRYFKALRIKMYSKMLEYIRYYSPNVCVYLCMESPGVWKEVFGFSPKNNLELKKMLDERC